MSKTNTNQGLTCEQDGIASPAIAGNRGPEAFGATFDTEKVLRLLGAKPGRRVSTASLRRMDSMAEKLQGITQPQLGYRVVQVSASDRSGIRLADGTRFKSPKLSRALRQTREVCCFLSTVGPVVDLEIQHLTLQRRYADAYTLDALGSMAVENMVERFYRRMARRQADKGAGITLRFSPGYCDWPLRDQRPLLQLFDAVHGPKVTLNDSCLMSPRKSVSGLFGLLPPGTPGSHPAYNPCNHCSQRNCIARRGN